MKLNLLAALLGVSLSGIAVTVVASSPQNPSVGSSGYLVLSVIFVASILGRYLALFREPNPTRWTGERLRGWFYLHAIYWVGGIWNGLILYGLFFYSLRGAFFPVWPLWVGVAILIALSSNYLIMQSLGQEYENWQGDSYRGAAAYARLARGMLMANSRYGVLQLKASVVMAKKLLRTRSFVPIDINAVSGTLAVLAGTPSLDYQKLSGIAGSLEKLPQVDTLPGAIKTFLDSLSWPRSFEHVEPEPRRSDYPRLTIFFSFFALLIAGVALLAESNREAILQIFGILITQNSLAVIEAGIGLIGVSVILYVLRGVAPFLAIRKYWPREDYDPDTSEPRPVSSTATS